VAVSGVLVALAAASAPFVTTAAASAALKNELVGLAPLATGLQIGGRLDSTEPSARALAEAGERRRRAASQLSAAIGLERPIFTVESPMPGAVLNGNGVLHVTLMARTDALRHLKILARAPGDGIWISDMTAGSARLKLGGVLRIQYSSIGQSGTRTVGLRVKGIYRALDRSAPDAYWANFFDDIYPRGVDPPPPQRYVFMTFGDLYRTTQALSIRRPLRNGQTARFATGPQLTTVTEMAVSHRGLTLARARALTRRFEALEHSLPRTALGRDLGCALPAQLAPSAGSPRLLCSISSSLSSAIVLADANAAAVSPIVSLLSGAGIGITLAVACAAGMFLVRRRRAEAALLFARGEHVMTFGLRSLAELLLPMLAGAATGFAVALGLTRLFAPNGSIDPATLTSAATHAAIATAAGLALAVGAAAVVFVRLFDTGTVERRWLRRMPWELLLLAAAGWLLHDVMSGGGIARGATGSGAHPTLAVFLLPLLLIAAVAGIAMRALRLILVRPGMGTHLRTPLFLALRRASAARASLTGLVVVAAVCFGAYFYAESLAASVNRSVAEKAYIAYGGDAQGFVSDSSALPRRYRGYPLTKLEYANGAATLADGAVADVIAVDPASLGSVMRWYRDWGRDPRPRLRELDARGRGALPAIVTSSLPAGTRTITLQGVRLPIHVVARVAAFPGMSTGVPLVVVSRGALVTASKREHLLDPLGVTQTYVWAKGPAREVARALEAPPVQASFVASVDDFRHDPDVLLSMRTLTYLRLIAAAAGALVFIGLLLYLQARQRSQALASALSARMGFRRAAETLSISVELAAIALVAAVLGGVVAVLAAKPIVRHVDPLPDQPPVPAAAIPVTAIVIALLALLLVAFTAGALTSWLSRRADTSEALRVA